MCVTSLSLSIPVCKMQGQQSRPLGLLQRLQEDGTREGPAQWAPWKAAVVSWYHGGGAVTAGPMGLQPRASWEPRPQASASCCSLPLRASCQEIQGGSAERSKQLPKKRRSFQKRQSDAFLLEREFLKDLLKPRMYAHWASRIFSDSL